MLFNSLQNNKNVAFTCYVSYFELYNESGYDLLSNVENDGSISNNNNAEVKKIDDMPKVTMLEDEDGNYHFRNLSVNQVNSEEDALNLLFIGDTNRAIGETQMNQSSSRSHCIFTLMVEKRMLNSDTVIRSKLNLVDLAGSERVHKTNSSGQTLKEAQYINSSLFFLEMVIVALHERTKKGKESVHVPYRTSMMTSVLRDSLGGNCKTIMVATISPEAKQSDESISTCHFAQRVALVKNQAYINEELEPELVIKRLKIELRRLREEVKFLKGENGEGEGLSDEQYKDLEGSIREYLDGEDGKELNMGSMTLTKIHASYSIFKKIFSERDSTKNNDSELYMEGSTSSNERTVQNLTKKLRQRDDEIKVLVEMVKKGKRSDNFVPASALDEANSSVEEIHGKSRLSQQSKIEMQVQKQKGIKVCGVERCTDRNVLDDPSTAFTWFRQRYHGEKIIEENKALLQTRFIEVIVL
jgi:kinesin family protein 6/9